MLDSARLKQILIINKTRNFLLLSPDLVTTTGANSGISESVRSARGWCLWGWKWRRPRREISSGEIFSLQSEMQAGRSGPCRGGAATRSCSQTLTPAGCPSWATDLQDLHWKTNLVLSIEFSQRILWSQSQVLSFMKISVDGGDLQNVKLWKCLTLTLPVFPQCYRNPILRNWKNNWLVDQRMGSFSSAEKC